MKKVFIIGFSDKKGGVENYITTLINNISKDNFEITLNMPIMEIGGIKWIRPKNRHNYFKYLYFWKKFFKNNKFDVIYYNTCDIVSIDMLKFAKKAGIPVRIIHSHNAGNQRKLNWFHKILEKRNRKNLYKYATTLIACSKVAGEWMFGENINYELINNAIALTDFQYSEEKRSEIRNELGIVDDYVVGMVGSLSYQKNPLFGIEVFKMLNKVNPNTVLLMVGEGELKGEIEQRVRQYNLYDKVKLLGRREDVSKVLSAMDCFLMTSLFEGFPFAMVEAQASSLPCVVSDNISHETNLCGNVHFVGLDESPAKWAKEILACRGTERRLDIIEELRKKGYDIERNINYIERIFLDEKNL